VKKIFLIIFLLICTNVHAGTVSRYFDYGVNSTVTSTNLNGNFDNILNTINGDLDNNNANVDGGYRFIEVLAALPAAGNQGRVVFLTANNTLNFDTGTSFLATALLANSQTFSGINTFTGNVLFNADVSIGNGGSDKLTINAPGGITYTPAATWTFTGNQTVSGTWADAGTMTTVDIDGGTIDGVTIGATAAPTVTDLGSVATADINGGTMDGVQVGGTTATGELLVNNASDAADGLGAQGDSGQFLQSAGAGANPVFADVMGVLISTTTHAGATNTGNIAIEPSKIYLVTMNIVNATDTAAEIAINFNSSTTATGYAYAGKGQTMNTTSVTTTDGDESHNDLQLLGATNSYAANIDKSSNNGFLKGHFFIDTNKISTAYSGFVHGQFIAKDSNSALITATFGGLNQENLTIADFELQFGQNMAFTIKVYELK